MKRNILCLSILFSLTYTFFDLNAENFVLPKYDQILKNESKAFEGVVKIMPLGNSITFDEHYNDTRPVGDRGGYRKYLYELLSAAGITFDFVGSEINGQNVFPDPENAGFPGITAAQLASLLQTGYNPIAGVQEVSGYYLDAYMPDIILLEIGTNGFTTSTADLESVLDEIDNYKTRTGNPAITILARIINRNPYHSPTSVFNENIASMLSARADSSIISVDMENDAGLIYASAPAGDMYDELHPVDKGYEKMAQLWVNNIMQVQDVLPDIPVFISQSPDTVNASGFYYYNAHAASVVKPQYSLSGAPTGITIDPDYGVIEWPSPVTGNYSFDVIATNISGQANQHIDLTVSNSQKAGYTDVFPNIVYNPNLRAQAVIMPEEGTIESISMYHQSGNGHALYGIYNDNASYPGTKIGETALFTVSSTEGWQTVSLNQPVSVSSGQQIWLAWVYENPPILYYGSGSPGRAHSTATYSGSLPQTFGSSTVADYQYSIYATYVTGTPPAGPPAAPENLQAGAGSSQVQLSWEHSQFNTTGFIIERKTGTGTFDILDSILSTTLTYTDFSVSIPGTYTYRIAAYNASGTSSFSNEAVAVLNGGSSSTVDVGNVSIFNQIVYNPNRRAQQITIPQDGSIESVSMYHGPVSGNVIFAVYSDQSDAPGSLLGVSASTVAAQTTDWQTIYLLSPVSVSAGQKVWLAWVYQNAAPIYYDNGTPGRAHSDQAWSGGMPSVFGTSSFSGYVYSIYATLSVSDIPDIPPATPSGLTAAQSTGSNIDLDWTDNADNETGYILERAVNGGNFSIINNSPANSESFSDIVPLTDADYSYRVKAVNSAGESDYSNTASVYVPVPPLTGEAGYPTIFNQVVYNGNRRAQKIYMPESGSIQQIAMYHGGSSGNLIYAVYSDNNGFPGSLLSVTPVTPVSTSTDWQFVNLNNQVTISAGEPVWLAWLYENPTMIFYDNGGDGRAHSDNTWPQGMPSDFGLSSVSNYQYSIYCIYQPGENTDPPLAPDALTGNYNAFTPEITLSWNDNSLNELEFIIERAENGGPFSEFVLLGANSNGYSDNLLSYNNSYQYRVFATNNYGNSGYSNVIEIETNEPVSSPISVGHTSVFDMQVISAYRRAQQITIPSDGQITSISMYHGSNSGNLLYGVYSDISDSPGTLLASTSVTLSSAGTGWQEVDLISPLTVNSGQKVWLAWVYQNGGIIYYTSGTPGRAHTEDYYTGSLPSDFGASSSANYIYSIYATLVPGLKSGNDGINTDPSQEVINTSFLLYPNPVYGNLFYISSLYPLEDSEEIRIEIIDLTGKLLQTENRTGTTISQPVIISDNLSDSNMILVRIITGSKVSVQKLILK